MRRSRVSVLIIALAVGLASAVLLTELFLLSKPRSLADETPVAIVNEDFVTAAELASFASQRRAAVIEYFMREHHAEVDKDFWTSNFRGESPGQVLLAGALEDAARMKVEFQLAQQYGVVNDISFVSVMREMKRENERRAAAVSGGEPIFGPLRFETSGFINYYRNKTASLLKKTIADTTLEPSEQQLRSLYKTGIKDIAPVEDRIVYEKFSVYYRYNGQQSDSLKEEAKQAAEALWKRLKSDVSAEEVLMELRGTFSTLTAHYEGNLVLEERNASRMYKSENHLYTLLRSSHPADPVQPVVDDPAAGCYKVVRVIEREDGILPDFEQVRDLLKRDYIDQVYEAKVETNMQLAKISWLKDKMQALSILLDGG